MKKIFAVLLSLALLMSLVPLGTITASATSLTVYVGGVGLANGEYLPIGSATPTTTKPSGGYAYYKDGTLTLNNYTYDGAGYSVPVLFGYTALVYSEKALTVKLVGTNTLTNSIDSLGVGIWVQKEDLTIIDGGSGALNITVKDDGIYTYNDDIDIQGGAITITADDCGICSEYNLTISGGTVIVNAEEYGIYSGSNLTISGGKITVNSGCYGIYVYDNVDISGGTVIVNAEECGIYSEYSLTISGGTVIVNAEESGICAYDNIDISGGTINVTAQSDGINTFLGSVTISGGTINVTAQIDGIDTFSGSVTISGGELDVTGDYQAISSDDIVLDGVSLQASTTKDGTLVDYVVADNDTYQRVVTAGLGAPTYSVIFYFGGDPLFDMNIEEGKTVEEPAEPAQDCKTFLGWYLGDTKYDFSKPVTKDIVLVATFKENHTYSNACDKSCNVCGNTRSTTHSYKTTTTRATTSKNGSVVKKCSVCGSQASKTTIYYAKKIKLSTTKYTYNGKARKPSVTVYDYKGNKISSSNYTVSYASGCKYVGKYKVTIKFKSKYSGTLTTYFTIIPKESKVSSLTAGKKSLKVKLSKVSSQASGYEIQYSTSKKFTSAKTKKVTSYKTTSVTLKSLKAKKTYYVRVRTYKTVNGTKYYSGWSTYKYKKTK